MRYLLMICSDESEIAALSEDESNAMLAEYGKFGESAGSALLGGERLQYTSEAVSVQVRDGKVITHDGPFAETKEQVGGFYIVDTPTVKEAIALAAKIPGARIGTIEVRPIWEMG
jgi:hypothetical protein